jgi:ribonuclease P protein component
VNRSGSRLSRSEDFARVYRTGRSVANKFVVLYYFERSEAGSTEVEDAGPRVGFSVSKRLGTAVDRNRIKRVLREAFRTRAALLRRNMDLVLIARAPISDLLEKSGFRGVEEKVDEVLRKASLVVQGDECRPSP